MTVTTASGGLAIEVSAPAALGGLAITGVSTIVKGNAAGNLASQTGRVYARDDNKLEYHKPDANTNEGPAGDHTSYKRDDNGDVYKYQEFTSNPRSPHGFEPGRRFDGGKANGQPGVLTLTKKRGNPFLHPTLIILLYQGEFELRNRGKYLIIIDLLRPSDVVKI